MLLDTMAFQNSLLSLVPAKLKTNLLSNILATGARAEGMLLTMCISVCPINSLICAGIPTLLGSVNCIVSSRSTISEAWPSLGVGQSMTVLRKVAAVKACSSCGMGMCAPRSCADITILLSGPVWNAFHTAGSFHDLMGTTAVTLFLNPCSLHRLSRLTVVPFVPERLQRDFWLTLHSLLATTSFRCSLIPRFMGSV